MGPLRVRSALLHVVVATLATLSAGPSPARAADSTAAGEAPCDADPDGCRRTRPPIAEEEWVRRAAPNELPAEHGLQLGIRLGVAHPGGSLGDGSRATTPRLSDLAETWVPFGLDAGYRLSPWVYLGGTLLWGGTFGNDNANCAVCGFRYDLHALADLRLYPRPRATVSPWFALGAGWEILHARFDDGAASATYQGPVLGSFQIGLDVRKGRVALGPYFGVELAEFVVRSLSPAPTGSASSVAGTSLHEWFTLGLRASYGP